MFLIPNIDLRDYASWVNPAKIVNVSAVQLKKNRNAFLKPYFLDKTIIISSIFRFDRPDLYFDMLRYLPKDQENIYLMTPDCNIFFQDSKKIIDRELSLMFQEIDYVINEYSEKYKLIGVLKGSNKTQVQITLNRLKPHCKSFLWYLTGFIKANPKYFSIKNNVETYLPENIPGELYFYGFNSRSIPYLGTLKKKYQIKGIITESYKIKATHSGNFRYKRKTRITKEWEKYKKLFEVEK
ncbi:hypothetical protein LCGC14_0800650 [marine sediment metagenome]|uniref:Uncharacterized protein n=1 Tax=marine sediment metagenome TaxID=412755 RepID=A0A0F9S9Q7_9ZZZZ